MANTRERELEHLKSMIAYLRHLGLLAFAGLVLTSNLSIVLFKQPTYKIFAYLSLLSFFISIITSLLSQIGHIDRIKEDIIYVRPLSNKFALPTAICMAGVLAGVMFMGVFVAVNWWQN